ncbi:hypothetical protein KBJ94_29230 [Pseudomonas sp. ITA]|uniref:contractile injection system tape measure protein n=1 Tax=Pseudomonas sp. ITA TaxID=2825841 RepID=UPI002496FC16|nr:contractile injection system tape measure protein [Pseudomonas sp. ITA]MDI2146133.1 hypothetical protein [Pseudomonas sp. ITA]
MNRIEQLRIVLDAPMDVANPLLDRCRQRFNLQWRKALATLLQQMSPAVKGTIKVPLIELDLGEIPLAQFDEEFGQRLLSALTAKLQSMMMGSDAGVVHMPGKGGSAAAHEALSEPEVKLAHPARQADRQADRLKSNTSTVPEVAPPLRSQLATFLRHGMASAALRECLASASDDWLLTQLATEPAAWRQLLADSSLRPDAMVRLLHCAAEAGLGEVCNLLFERKGSWPTQGTSAWAFSLMVGALLTQARLAPSAIVAPERGYFMQLVPGLKLPPVIQPLLAQAIVQLATPLASPAVFDWLRMLCLDSGQWPHLALHLSEAERHHLQTVVLKEPPPATPKRAVLDDLQPSAQNETFSLGRAGQGAGRSRSGGGDLLSTVAAEPWPVSNAGLVVIWPLLPGVFSQLGLQKDGQFIDEQAQCRAVCWLDEWLWGDGAQAEWRTPLTKLLCGLTPDAPLFPWAELTAEASAGLDGLLQALLAQIPALTRCSADEVRRWFLQRPGSLLWKNRQWTLQVEADAGDVLLMDLPWPKDNVPFPWMETPLKILWY